MSLGHIGNKIVSAGQYKYHNDLFDLTFETRGAFSCPFLKRTILRGINLKNVRGPHYGAWGPYVARGPDVAQACLRVTLLTNKINIGLRKMKSEKVK